MSSSCGSDSCSSGTCGSQDAAIAQQDNAIKTSLGKIKYKILVMSGKGGVGKSTVSTNLALGLAKRGYKVGLMDVDIHGPDVPRMLGLKETLGLAQNRKLTPLNYSKMLKVVSLEKDRVRIIFRGEPEIRRRDGIFWDNIEQGKYDLLREKTGAGQPSAINSS